MCVNVKRAGRFLPFLSHTFLVVFHLLSKSLSLCLSIFPFLPLSLSVNSAHFFLFPSHVPFFTLTASSLLPSHSFFFLKSLFLALFEQCFSKSFFLCFCLFLSLSHYIRPSHCASAHLFSFPRPGRAHILCLAGVVMVLIGGWPGY